MGANCPKCGVEFSPEFVIDATKDSRMSLRLSPGENGMMMADTVGGSIQATAKLIAASGRAYGHKAVLMIESIEKEPDGSLRFDFICARASAPKRNRVKKD